MATVYRARDLRHNRTVAIKVLHEDLSAAVGHERFRREIQIAGHLTHPNILPVFDSGEVGDALYLVMPFVEGESLRARIARERQLVLEDAVRIASEVAGALDFAHRQGVVHRDIKPENILLGDGHAFVADFGIARAINTAGDEQLTRSGVTLGTPMYMSPEQGTAQRNIDGRSDIYSLGCCLYEMLAGTPPFTGPTAQVVIARHTLEQAPSLVIARQSVPEHVEATVMRALAKSPADRFRTASDFADALNGRTVVTMPRISGVSVAVGSPPTPTASRIARLGAVSVVLVAGAIVGGWLWRQPRAAARTTSDLNPRRIAVMYFEDRTNSRLAYLADGLTEALIDRLRGVRDLDVISANGVRGFAATTPPDSVAHALSAGTIVQGSVEAAQGDSVRVTLRMVEGSSGVDFRRASFSGAAGDALRLRDDLANRAETFLRQRLGEEIRLQSRRVETKSATAWALGQQAERAAKDADALARDDSLDAAAARFARADSMLAEAEHVDDGWTEPIVLRGSIAYRQARLAEDRLRASDWISRGLGHAQRALALDDRSADALELRGSLRYLRRLLNLEPNPTQAAALLRDAEADLRSAVSISPTNASAWSVLSHLNYQKPDFTEAKITAQRAYEEDAYLAAAPDIVWRLYTTSYDSEDFLGANQWCAEGRQRFTSNPRFIECQIWVMTAPAARPDIPRAWSLLDSLKPLPPPAQWAARHRELQLAVAAAIARAASAPGADRTRLADSARRVAERTRTTRAEDPEGEQLGQEALVHVVLGDNAAAIRLLKEYLALNPTHRSAFSKGNSWWCRPLRDDQNFSALLR